MTSMSSIQVNPSHEHHDGRPVAAESDEHRQRRNSHDGEQGVGARDPGGATQPKPG